MNEPSPAFAIRDIWNLPTRHLGRVVTVYHEADSTNTRAAQAPLRGHAFLADRQSAGRGQHGRIWQAPARSSVLLSVVVHPPADLARPAILTAWAAVSVSHLVRDLTGLDCGIKWPNDLLLERKKLCGILIEQGIPGEPTAAIAGIGLNVDQSLDDFACGNLPAATSLRLVGQRRFDSDEVARRLLRRLDEEYDSLQGDLRSLESAWIGGVGLLDREVFVECAGTTHHGRLIEARFTGLVIERIGKAPLILPPESILQLREA